MITRDPPIGLGLALALAALAPGCASESAPEPEPTIYTRGAFVAVRVEDGHIRLSRTLDTFEVQTDTSLIETEYAVTPVTFEEARLLAKLPELPIRLLVTASSGNSVEEREHEVVWYRTLTEEERSRAE